jgi:signal recognition particle subunit SRP54
MLQQLSDKLQGIFRTLTGRGKLSEANIQEAVRAVRMALLEADVHLGVVKEFIAGVKARAVGVEVLESLNPGQQFVGIVRDEFLRVMGTETARLELSGHPSVIMVCGLQGSGKTTTCAKLAHHLRTKGMNPLLLAADVYRPAAIEQLKILGRQHDLAVYAPGADVPPPRIVADGLSLAVEKGHNPVIIDTAGRLHVDEAMMAELRTIRSAQRIDEVLFVADSMTGQDAVNSARAFNEQLSVTGVVLTKLDGDTRGGAALSIRHVTGKPVKFVGLGEKIDALEPFHADRLVGRLLGMGDMLSLIEKVEQKVDEKKAKEMEKRLLKGKLNFDDFLEQMQQLQAMGPLDQILGMLPGVKVNPAARGMAEGEMSRMTAIVRSMTRPERQKPEILSGSRRQRIAAGSGTTVQDVNRLLKQFGEMQKMMGKMGKMSKQLAKLGINPAGFSLPGMPGGGTQH